MPKRTKFSVKEVNVHEAKTHLSALLQRVAAGGEVIIANRGVPVARIVPIAPPKKLGSFLGIDRDRLKVPDDFNAPLPHDLLVGFWGGEEPDGTTAK